MTKCWHEQEIGLDVFHTSGAPSAFGTGSVITPQPSSEHCDVISRSPAGEIATPSGPELAIGAPLCGACETAAVPRSCTANSSWKSTPEQPCRTLASEYTPGPSTNRFPSAVTATPNA